MFIRWLSCWLFNLIWMLKLLMSVDYAVSRPTLCSQTSLCGMGLARTSLVLTCPYLTLLVLTCPYLSLLVSAYPVQPDQFVGDGVGPHVALEVDIVAGPQVVGVQALAQPQRHPRLVCKHTETRSWLKWDFLTLSWPSVRLTTYIRAKTVVNPHPTCQLKKPG